MSVSVATANVQRIFHKLILIKIKLERLEVPTLCGILRTKDFLKKITVIAAISCCNQFRKMAIKFTKEMFKSNWY